MTEIKVSLGERSYKIQIASASLNQTGASARAVLGEKARSAIIVTNQTVEAFYGKAVAGSLKRAGFRTDICVIGDGERYKSLRTAESIYTFLIQRGIERSDVMIALGGGVVGDIAGFVAATYLRGIRFVQIPTTLLAQIDSSVGGKTGVNHSLGKNLIGAFHQPALVIIDPDTLRTLPPREMRAGLCEAIKYGVIRDRRFFNRMTRDMKLLKEFDAESLIHLIARCCSIKADVVEQDEREDGLRRILNYGHTVGHALEAVTHYRRFLHGEAVGHGMRVAARIAERMKLLASDDREAIEEAVKMVGPLPRTNNLALDGIISAMNHDKKAEAGRVAFILPVEIGKVVIRSDVPLQLVRSALKDALS